MQEERRVANGTPKREPSGAVACGANEDSSRARRELRRGGCGDRASSGNLDLWGFENSDEKFVQLINSVVPTLAKTVTDVLLFSRHGLVYEEVAGKTSAVRKFSSLRREA